MSTEIRIVSSEGAHWYDRHGNPMYEVPNKSKPGEMRPTTLRDARKLDLVPSVTSVQKIKARPFLQNWKISKYLEEALTFPLDGRQPAEVIPEIIERVQAELARPMELGSLIHAEIEKHILLRYRRVGYDPSPDVDPKIIEALDEWINIHRVTCCDVEKSFASPHGYGGKVDLVCRWGAAQKLAVVDWKTTDTQPDKPFRFYDDWCSQLAAYSAGLFKERNIDGEIDHINVAFSRNEPGRMKTKVWKREEVIHGLSVFFAELNLWSVDNKYYPKGEDDGRDKDDDQEG